jgi:glycine betaine/proline transport system ATP-binding protein
MHKTIIFITHDFAEALRLGDRIAIMKDGEFVQVGTPESLVLNPQTDYVRAFTRDAPRDKVIAARTIMRPCPPGSRPAPEGRSVQPATKLEDILPLVAASDSPVAVVEDEAGDVLGYVDRTCVMQALLG